MRQRRLAVYVAFTVVMLFVAEMLSYATIYVANPLLSEPVRTTRDIYREQSDHIRRWLQMDGRGRDLVDDTLGWRYRTGHANAENRINSQGLRSDREYLPEPPEGVLRVAAFGDSFVYGNEVANDYAWPYLVESGFDEIEMLNYGVGGYGLDQALLRYRSDKNTLSPHVVLIGFIPDDIRRVVNVYQRFASTNNGIFTKPRFALAADGVLQLMPSPIKTLEDWRPIIDEPGTVREWGRHDQWYEPLVYENPLYDVSASVRLLSTAWIRLDNRYFDRDRLFVSDQFNPAATAFKLQMAIFRSFVAEAAANGSHALILFLPSRGELQAALAGSRPVYNPMLEQLRADGIEYWDATEAFLPLPDVTSMNVWFAPGGHYSPEGNRLVAQWLGPLLLKLRDQAAD
jgi:hypothetical protein